MEKDSGNIGIMSETLYGLRLFAFEVYNTTMNALIEEKIKMLPDAPGVYKMLDSSGNVIYVGKAKSLKNRVRQYFRSQNNMERKVVAMVSHIADFEYVLTGSETEAFALESNLIKAYKPQYNILLKDDKHFPYIRVDLNQDYPRFDVVRRVGNDSARYFGPYINSNAMNSALSVIRDYYPVRLCKKDIAKAMARHERPCLMYHIGKCSAPCAGAVTKEEYRAHVMRAVEFLKGDSNDVAPQLEKAMNAAAQRMEFELAAALRDRLQSVNALLAAQKAIVTPDRAMDVLALCKLDETIIVFSLFVRGGKVVGTQHADMKVQQDSADDEIMGSYIKQTYSDVSEFPNELIVNVLPDEVEELSDYLSSKLGKRVRIHVPVRGEKREYVDMAVRNGNDMLNKQRELLHRQWERGEGALISLGELLGMERIPHRIECFDNSHIMGTDTVGAMVVFTDGKPDKNEYRRFKIKCEAKGDDYLAMREVLTRRFERALTGDSKFVRLPDLIIVDGGRGQLNVALDVLSNMGVYGITVVGLAEENEELILPDADEPLRLSSSSPVQHLAVRIRDEAHRFAISYHRSLRQRNALFSVLDNIEGIGDKRKRALYDEFVSLERIKAADIDALRAVKRMNAASAEAVYNYFHSTQNKTENRE